MANSKNEAASLHEILSYEPSGELVVSMYLLVDGLRVTKKDYLTTLNSMIASSREELESNPNLEKAQKKKLLNVVEDIKKYVNDNFRPYSTKTLLVYASDSGLWKVLRLPVIMKSKIIIDPKPHTQSIRTILQNYKRYGILLLDREKAQIYSMYFGEIREYLAAFISDVPPKVNLRRQAVLREKKLLSRMEEKLHQFFKLVNDRTLELFREGKFDYLILAGKKEILSNFANYMHSYLQPIRIGSIEAEPDSSKSLIQEKAQKIIDKFEVEYKNDLVGKLLDEYNPNRLGVVGIEAVIGALLIEQIKTLIYDRQFIKEGYICSGCHYLTISDKISCPYCGGKLVFYNDIVDEVVEDALSQGCEIVDIGGNERLRKAGNIGAVLRYKL
jgi:peptide chain release factor subunit 1